MRLFTPVQAKSASAISLPETYPGFDLLRVVGSLGVVFCHVFLGREPWLAMDWMLQVRVPVFMLLALYLSAEQWSERRSVQALSERLQRLIVPMVAWGVFELVFYRLWNIAAGCPDTRPINLAMVFLGQESVRYFLAWLAVATVVVYVLSSIGRLWHTGASACMVCFLSMNAGEGVQANLAGHSLAHYIGSALPYAAIAMVFCRWPRPTVTLAMVGLLINHYAGPGVQGNSSWALVGATGALLFGLGVPASWRMPWLVRHLAGCTYGIYLGHMIALMLVLKVCKWTGLPVECRTSGMVGVALVTFAVSWAGTVILQQWGWTRAVFLGQTQKKHFGAGTRVCGVVLRPTKKEKGKGPEIKELCGGVALIRQ